MYSRCLNCMCLVEMNGKKKIFLLLKILNTLEKKMSLRGQLDVAQLNAGNNSEKLKNEIRKLLYSLYRSQKHTKQLYKS